MRQTPIFTHLLMVCSFLKDALKNEMDHTILAYLCMSIYVLLRFIPKLIGMSSWDYCTLYSTNVSQLQRLLR